MSLVSRRRGSIYLVVLATSVLVVTMALLGLELARRDVFASVVGKDSIEARMAAESGVDQAIAFMHESGWRNKVGGGTIGSGVKVGNATYTASIVDTVGDITVPSLNVLKVTSVGTSGNSRVALEVNARAAAVIPEHLNHVVCAQTSLSFESLSSVSGNGTIRAGTSSLAVLSTIAQRVTVGTTATGLTYTGGVSVDSTPLSTIDMASVISYYKSIGTAVRYSRLSGGKIENQVVAQDVTPWGLTNTYGVYIIDCENNLVSVRDSRIVATLVFINATSGVEISRSVSWFPGLSTYPVALCDGKLSLLPSSAVLSEVSTSVNFNPPGAAGTDRIGVTDADKLDTYTSRIMGLVVADSLHLGNALRLFGTAISLKDVRFTGSVQLGYDISINNPPAPGFTFPGEIYLTEGSFSRTIK